ncbi:MAG: potassium-transporting ATPase subunit F [Bryobacterales bacterium]|nr:potassium-transporting ATPase subunit F [Bryobacterales bacterium]
MTCSTSLPRFCFSFSAGRSPERAKSCKYPGKDSLMDYGLGAACAGFLLLYLLFALLKPERF